MVGSSKIKISGSLQMMEATESFFISPPERFKGEMLNKSRALSADVNAAYNPLFPENFDARNGARLGNGVALTPYTGSGGKYSTSEAPIEETERIERVLDREGVAYQTGILGSVDGGGGGTIAKYAAQLQNGAPDVVDAGPALWSMHSPASEIMHVYDLYSTEKAMEAYFRE